MIPVVLEWRKTSAKYADLNLTVYSDRLPFVDQTISIESTALWSITAALICTAAACFIFIPNIICIFCAVLSVFSSSIGIFGILSKWGIDLDPLSTAALIMGIGFSVDFTAHIVYHYYKADADTPAKRVELTLIRIGWPLTQVGLSTVVALSPVLFKQSYLTMVFMKAVIVVVSLGLAHGLVIMPAILTAIMPYKSGFSKRSVNSSERNSQNSSEGSNSFYKRQKAVGGQQNVASNDIKEQKTKDGSSSAAQTNIVAPMYPLDTTAKRYVHNIKLGLPATLDANDLK